MDTTIVALQRAARAAWRNGRHEEAARLYRQAAHRATGYAKMINLACAADCDLGEPFDGTPEPD